MKRILINDHNLEEDELDYDVVRVKGLVINSNNELIIVENNNTYQLPGGHARRNEPLEDTLAREIREELGIALEINNGPFLMITTYDNNYFDTGSKVGNKIYYYIVRTDLEPDINNLSLDAIEKETDFNILKVNVSDLEAFLNDAISCGRIDPNIGREMLLVCNEYNEVNGG